ncbi:MAG: ATP synthase F1 subunit epsilon [Actinomycetes bacterium]|jgi:F-type H+-transporting ATPase subunit epsilon|nr:ATP synthase F1 subunit epsilon [Actinomycetes bacterium]
MARSLLVEVVTPDATVFSGEVESVVVTTPEGELGVLPMHAPLVARLGKGQLRLRPVGKEAAQVFTTEGGYFQVAEDKAIVLTDSAQAADAA